MFKYKATQDFCIPMTSYRQLERPLCEEILNGEPKWALGSKEFDSKTELNLLSMTDESAVISFIYSFIKWKLSQNRNRNKNIKSKNVCLFV
jgi:hypothetical protein